MIKNINKTDNSVFSKMSKELLHNKGKRVLAISALSSSLILGTTSHSPLKAQAQFEDPIPYPGDINPSTFPFILQSEFHDIDNDGDLDILGTVYDTAYYYFEDIVFIENIGSRTQASYTEPKIIDVLSPQISQSFFTFGDMDNDGDIDGLHNVLTYGYDSTGIVYEREFIYYENESEDSLNFKAPVINPGGLELYKSVKSFSFPSLVDADGDKDLDIMAIELEYADEYAETQLIYIENTGTQDSFHFSEPMELNTPLKDTSGGFLLPTFGDLDSDGDTDVLGVVYDYQNYAAYYVYMENESVNNTFQFDSLIINPFNLDTVAHPENAGEDPVFVDYDQDGDLDIFATKYAEPKAKLYLNSPTSSIRQLNWNDLGIEVFPNPVRNTINLRIPQSIKGEVQLLSSDGKVLLNRKIKQSQMVINVRSLTAGIYMLHLDANTVQASTQIIIKD